MRFYNFTGPLQWCVNFFVLFPQLVEDVYVSHCSALLYFGMLSLLNFFIMSILITLVVLKIVC